MREVKIGEPNRGPDYVAPIHYWLVPGSDGKSVVLRAGCPGGAQWNIFSLEANTITAFGGVVPALGLPVNKMGQVLVAGRD